MNLRCPYQWFAYDGKEVHVTTKRGRNAPKEDDGDEDENEEDEEETQPQAGSSLL